MFKWFTGCLRLGGRQPSIAVVQVRYKKHQITKPYHVPRSVEYRLMKEVTQPLFDKKKIKPEFVFMPCPTLRRLEIEAKVTQ